MSLTRALHNALLAATIFVRQGVEMNETKFADTEKQAECERICMPIYGKNSRFHSIAPEICPIAEDLWKNPKRKPSL
jgi:hypothetical protein